MELSKVSKNNPNDYFGLDLEFPTISSRTNVMALYDNVSWSDDRFGADGNISSTIGWILVQTFSVPRDKVSKFEFVQHFGL